MSILTYRPSELIESRKIVSDAINDTDELSFSNSRKPSSHGDAAKQVRDKKAALNIKKLELQTNDSYFEDLFKEC